MVLAMMLFLSGRGTFFTSEEGMLITEAGGTLVGVQRVNTWGIIG